MSIGGPEGGKAQRIYLLLREDILAGVRPSGTVLPGEHRLAAMFGVSRVTVRRALDALSSEGLVLRRAGAGTIVVDTPSRMAGMTADLTTLMPQIQRMGTETTARLLSFAYVAPPATVARHFGCSAGEEVQRAVRVRLARGLVFSHLTTHVPGDIARNYSEADLATTPLFRLLERSGVRVARATQTISATLATPEVADALDLATGAALISLTRVVQDDAGRGVEHLQALYRPDRFRLEMVLNRVGEAEDRHWEPVAADVAQAAGQAAE